MRTVDVHAAKLVAALRRQSEGAPTWCSNQAGQRTCRSTSTIDRDSAARLGHQRRQAVDNALYDAFGQRIVSTIFTQSNHA